MNKTRPFKELISLEEAQERLFSRIKPTLQTEQVELAVAQNRIIARDIIATIDVPPFSRAAMDGYAVIAEETYGAGDLNPRTLNRIGSVYAGDVPEVSISSGECVSIATGAMLPEGADGVVMVEYTEENNDEILIHRPVHPGENISNSGSDIKKGSSPITSNLELTASRLGAVAALGINELEVFTKPKVAIAGTGNEISPLGKKLEPGQVYDINSYTLASVVSEAGGEPVLLGLVNDTREALEAEFETAFKVADMVVFTGGSSVGERDLLIDVFSAHGEVLFHGVQLKPGKPVLAADTSNGICFGFPGYPTSCLTAALLFLGPAVRKMAHRPSLWPRTLKTKLARKVPSTLGRTQVLTVKLEGNLAHPAFKESGAITSMAEADGYIIIPSNVDMLGKDEDVDVFLL
jgi:molybdenum cofactor synthesis domain-containing protein